MIIEFLLRLILTIVLAPIALIIPSVVMLPWVGYEERRDRKREEAKQRRVAHWMAAHPIEAARVTQEMERRREELERQAKAAREQRAADLAAEWHRARLLAEEEQREIEAALAIPLSERKQKLLSAMPFSPSLSDLKRFAEEP